MKHDEATFQGNQLSKGSKFWLGLGIPLGLCLVYTLGFSWLSIQRYERYLSHAFDLSIYDQVLWRIRYGFSGFSTVRGLPILGDHFTPILYPLSLLYWIKEDVRGLLIFQSLILGLGAIPLYHLAYQKTQSLLLSTCLALSYLLYPPLQSETDLDTVKTTLEKKGLTFYEAETDRIQEIYHLAFYPRVFVVNPQGRLVFIQPKPLPPSELQAAVRTALHRESLKHSLRSSLRVPKEKH